MFPYKGIGPRSYYTVTPDGVLNQLHAVGELREAIKRAKHDEVALIAVRIADVRPLISRRIWRKAVNGSVEITWGASMVFDPSGVST